ncbi:MAG: hypothetical protein MUC65_10900, partial [Pontiellaceae bacterium]|nr:hypothetical protein [Pontiellaceae bacterium]
MTARKLISFFCLLSLAITAGSVPGSPKIYFTGQADDGEWNNAANWEGGVVPGNEDRASIPSGVIKITNTVTTGYLQNGIDTGGVAQVIIDGGSLVAVGTVRFNSASYIGRGSIIIQNGGSAVFNSRFMV